MFQLIDQVQNHDALRAVADDERERRWRKRRAGQVGAPVRRRAASALRRLADHLDSQPPPVRVPSQRFETAE
ncbi:MAG TPA: hypothetical protein PKA49_08375 [Tepidiformaceae bacterium]|jgi:hypothetical protein|nr:hypothetical protein [Thermoflexaceae bacterium]HMS58855.1 hypothetical protein [Tepidiformaceae bacterium]